MPSTRSSAQRRFLRRSARRRQQRQQQAQIPARNIHIEPPGGASAKTSLSWHWTWPPKSSSSLWTPRTSTPLSCRRKCSPVSPRRSYIYAALGPDLYEHLKRIEGFNTRAEHPTDWELDIHTTNDPLRRMTIERPGNVVVIAGHSGNKMDRIRASLDAGLNVLADKPWIIHASQIPALEAALALADRSGLVAYDIMTERYEPTNMIQKGLVNDPAVFGTMVAGTEQDPGVVIESVHHLLKLVAGQPNLRPAFFFDASDQGTALADVGTHLLDLVQWTLFPDQSVRTQDLHVGPIRPLAHAP